MIFDIHFVTVLMSGLTAVVIGSVWYAPFVFGNIWMQHIQMTPQSAERAKKLMPFMILAGFVFAMVLAWVLTQFAAVWGAVTLGSALELGFWIWLGFMVPPLLAPVLWEQKKVTYFAINAGYWLLTTLAIATIVSLWG